MSRRRSSLTAQAGFTLVEVMVGMAIALAAVAGTTSVIAKSTKNTLGQQREVQALGLAEREIEVARSVVKRFGFEALALSAAPQSAATPTVAANPSDPRELVSGANLAVYPDWHDTARGTGAAEPLVVGGTAAHPTAGQVAPLTTEVAVGPLRADVHRFVSRPTMPTGFCSTGAGTCDGDARRITVAVVPKAPGRDGAGAGGDQELQRTKPIYLTTILTAPVPRSRASSAGGGLSLGVALP